MVQQSALVTTSLALLVPYLREKILLAQVVLRRRFLLEWPFSLELCPGLCEPVIECISRSVFPYGREREHLMAKKLLWSRYKFRIGGSLALRVRAFSLQWWLWTKSLCWRVLWSSSTARMEFGIICLGSEVFRDVHYVRFSNMATSLHLHVRLHLYVEHPHSPRIALRKSIQEPILKTSTKTSILKIPSSPNRNETDSMCTRHHSIR